MSVSGLPSLGLDSSEPPKTRDQRPKTHRLTAVAAWFGGAAAFALLATANGAGYRYGASDQAFYVPAIIRSANPQSFPRDGTFIDAEGRLMVIDDLLGLLVRTSGVAIESVCLTGYLLSLGVLWAGLTLIGRRLYGQTAATLALAAAFSLRHQISRTSANSFEPYFHPRMLAFGLGLLAIATLLRRPGDTAARPSVARSLLPIVFVAAAGLVHITTGLWFAVLIGVALIVLDPPFRKLALLMAVVTVLCGAWAIAAGPLRGALHIMDPEWLRAVAGKDTLFATDWPLWAWVANLMLWGLLYWAHRVRRGRGDSTPEDRALFWGATALVLLFLVTLPAVGARVTLPVQLQISRVFWLVDFVATVYVLAVLVETPTRRRQMARITAAALIALSAGRGIYVMLVEHPDRPLFAVTIPDSPWQRAMEWLSDRPIDVHVLADPGHAWRYGASIRVSPGRDVLLEEVKDSALAIYSRDAARRFLERTAAIDDFAALSADRARTLAQRYDLDYLVTSSDMQLPEVYRNQKFRIYALRESRAPPTQPTQSASSSTAH